MCAQCTHLCTALVRGRCRASQGLGSCRHHFRAEFYEFSWVPLLVTQSLRLEIYFLFYSSPFFLCLISSVWGPLVPSQLLGCQPPAGPVSLLPLTVCMQLIALFSQADPGASLAPEGEIVASAKSLVLLLLLHMTLLHPDAAGCTLLFHLRLGNCPLETHPHLTCSHSTECCQHASFQDSQICSTTKVLER